MGYVQTLAIKLATFWASLVNALGKALAVPLTSAKTAVLVLMVDVRTVHHVDNVQVTRLVLTVPVASFLA